MNQAGFKKSVEGLFKQQEKLLARRNRKSPGGNGVYDRYELHDLIPRTLRGGGDDDGTLLPPSLRRDSDREAEGNDEPEEKFFMDDSTRVGQAGLRGAPAPIERAVMSLRYF